MSGLISFVKIKTINNAGLVIFKRNIIFYRIKISLEAFSLYYVFILTYINVLLRTL